MKFIGVIVLVKLREYYCAHFISNFWKSCQIFWHSSHPVYAKLRHCSGNDVFCRVMNTHKISPVTASHVGTINCHRHSYQQEVDMITYFTGWHSHKNAPCLCLFGADVYRLHLEFICIVCENKILNITHE